MLYVIPQVNAYQEQNFVRRLSFFFSFSFIGIRLQAKNHPNSIYLPTPIYNLLTPKFLSVLAKLYHAQQPIQTIYLK